MIRGWGHKPLCPYCGGSHPAGECPMMKYPPAMPMPSVPMPPMGGYMPPMGGMPAGGYPMPPAGGMPPMGEMPMGNMHEMHQHMEKVEKMLADIMQCCTQMNTMVKEIYMKMAKG